MGSVQTLKFSQLWNTLFACILILFCSCKKNENLVGFDVTQNGQTITSPPSLDYKLVFLDDFLGYSLDTTKWNYRSLGQWRQAVNTKDAIILDGNGNLVIKTYRIGSTVYTGMIDTRNRFDFKYGYFECRVKLQQRLGLWSAYWLLPYRFTDGSSPLTDGTEIDIFEHFVRNGPDIFKNDLWWGGYGSLQTNGPRVCRLPGLSSGFHTFGFEWTPTENIFSVDGYRSWSSVLGISQQREFLILSCEVQDNAAGVINDPNFQDQLVIDYVKVYSKE